jgi:hypothetical protein
LELQTQAEEVSVILLMLTLLIILTRIWQLGNERRPICGNCYQKGDACEWGVRLSFRDENVQTISQNHPSMRQDTASRRDGRIEVRFLTFASFSPSWSNIGMLTDRLRYLGH